MISSRQMLMFIFLLTIGDSIIVVPSIPAVEARQDAWIVAVFSVAIGSLVVFLYSSLSKLYPRLSLIEYSQLIFGKWIGITISVLFLSYTLIINAMVLREIGDFMTIQILEDTPIEAVLILFTAAVLIVVRLGLEPIVRTSEIFFPYVVVFSLFVIIALLPLIKIDNLFPILAEGFPPIIRGSFTFIAYSFVELTGILMILQFVNENEKLGKSLFIGVLLGGIILAILTALSILILGYENTSRQQYPSYTLVKKINIADFFTRVEALFATIWIITIFFKMTLYFFITILGLSQLFKLKDYRLLVFPYSILLIVLTLIVASNIIIFNYFLKEIMWLTDLTFGFVLPIMLLIVGKYRISKKEEKFN